MDTLFPDSAQAVVHVLEYLGVKVNIPEGQTCCGQPAFNGGFWNEAREMAQYNLDLLSKVEGPIIIPSGSCGAMLIHQYPELFRDDPLYGPKARALTGRVFEFTQYLVDTLHVTNLGAVLPAKVVYHPSCHTLRGLNIDRQPRALLKNVSSLEILDQDSPQTCCGFGGVFAITMPEISGAMLANRLAAFEATGADFVVGCDVSCLMHIEGGFRKEGSRMRTMYIGHLLAEGLKS